MSKRAMLVMMMAAVEMIYGWASSAHTAWDAPMGIWAYIAGLNHFGQPANHIGPIVLGLGGHMMNSMIIGIVFVALMRMLRNPPGILMLGTAYGVGVWALMRYVLLPLNTPNDRLFTTSLISPQWVWWVAHVALGMTAGLVYLLFGQRRLAGQTYELGHAREHHVHPAAMTAYQELVQSGENDGNGEPKSDAERWHQAPAPAKVAKRILEGIFHVDVSADRIPLLTNATHWLYGSSLGTVYGTGQGTIRANPIGHGLVFGAGVWGFSYAQLVPMGVYEPPWTYPAKTLAVDLSYHLVYGLGVAAAYEGL